MSATDTLKSDKHEHTREMVQTYLAEAIHLRDEHRPHETSQLTERIKALLKQHNAVLVAHYYTAPEIQALADETGGHVADSLEMARFGKNHPADTLIVAGVKFMGETAKILSPEKRVLMR